MDCFERGLYLGKWIVGVRVMEDRGSESRCSVEDRWAWDDVEIKNPTKGLMELVLANNRRLRLSIDAPSSVKSF